jgi:hypothetical protein
MVILTSLDYTRVSYSIASIEGWRPHDWRRRRSVDTNMSARGRRDHCPLLRGFTCSQAKQNPWGSRSFVGACAKRCASRMLMQPLLNIKILEMWRERERERVREREGEKKARRKKCFAKLRKRVKGTWLCSRLLFWCGSLQTPRRKSCNKSSVFSTDGKHWFGSPCIRYPTLNWTNATFGQALFSLRISNVNQQLLDSVCRSSQHPRIKTLIVWLILSYLPCF